MIYKKKNINIIYKWIKKNEFYTGNFYSNNNNNKYYYYYKSLLFLLYYLFYYLFLFSSYSFYFIYSLIKNNILKVKIIILQMDYHKNFTKLLYKLYIILLL